MNPHSAWTSPYINAVTIKECRASKTTTTQWQKLYYYNYDDIEPPHERTERNDEHLAQLVLC